MCKQKSAQHYGFISNSVSYATDALLLVVIALGTTQHNTKRNDKTQFNSKLEVRNCGSNSKKTVSWMVNY